MIEKEGKNMNYATYPTKTMRITQNYNGTTSHKPHTTGNPKDYPIDEGCADTGRDYCYCPCDEMTIKRIYGVGTGGTNTIWLESTSKVDFANGKSDILSISATHPNDDDLSKLKVGQTFKRGEKICREGNDGATGYHFHFSFGIGKITGNGWTQNSSGKWVLTTTGGAAKPEDILYLDKSFTKVVNSGGLNFKELPKTTAAASTAASAAKYTTGNYKVTANLLHVRTGAGTNYAKKTFSQLSADAQKKIKSLNGGKGADGYVKGVTFTASQVSGNWGKTPSGWVCLDYCKKI